MNRRKMNRECFTAKRASARRAEAKPKIAVLWTAPRCVSSAFLKVLSQHPLTAVVDEPFLEVYYFSQWRRSDRFGDLEEKWHYGATQAIHSICSQTASLIFAKEMSYQALPYVDRTFFGSMINTFIVRDPREAIASWYRLGEYPTEEEFGFRSQKKVFDIVTKELNHEPIVVDANAFRRNPRRILEIYCRRLEIEFDLRMLKWSKSEEKPRKWRSAEWQSMGKWNKTLENSTGILPPAELETEVEIRPEDKDMLQRAMKIYTHLSQFTL